MTREEFKEKYLVKTRIAITDAEMCLKFQEIAFEFGLRTHRGNDIPISFDTGIKGLHHLKNLFTFPHGLQSSSLFYVDDYREIVWDEMLADYESLPPINEPVVAKIEAHDVSDCIKLLRTYFIDKISKGDFEVIDKSEHTIRIKIDGQYYFTLWWANGADYVGFYKCEAFDDEQDLVTFQKLSLKDRRAIWKSLSKIKKEYKEVQLKNQKLAEYNKLKKELNL